MSDSKKCDTCAGCGKVDHKEGKPWKDITAKPNPRVTSGELQPVHCPDCNGRGTKDKPDESAAAVAAPEMHTITGDSKSGAVVAAPAPVRGAKPAPKGGAN